MLRDFYFSKWKSNGRLYVFAAANWAVAYAYMSTYELVCGKHSPCPGEVSVGESLIALFPAVIHMCTFVDALKSTR